MVDINHFYFLSNWIEYLLFYIYSLLTNCKAKQYKEVWWIAKNLHNILIGQTISGTSYLGWSGWICYWWFFLDLCWSVLIFDYLGCLCLMLIDICLSCWLILFDIGLSLSIFVDLWSSLLVFIHLCWSEFIFVDLGPFLLIFVHICWSLFILVTIAWSWFIFVTLVKITGSAQNLWQCKENG